MDNRIDYKPNVNLVKLFAGLSVILYFVGLGVILLIVGLKLSEPSLIPTECAMGVWGGLTCILSSIYIIKHKDEPEVFVKGAFTSLLTSMGIPLIPMLIFFFILTKKPKKKESNAQIRNTFDVEANVGDIVPFAGRDWIVLRRKGKEFILFDYRGNYCEKYDDAIEVYVESKKETFFNTTYFGTDINGDSIYVRESRDYDVPIYETKGASSWKQCYLRKWLNEWYLQNCFNDEDRSRLIPVDYDLMDKVSLLNSEEFEALNNKGAFALRNETPTASTTPYYNSYRFNNEYQFDGNAFWLCDKKYVSCNYNVAEFKPDFKVQVKSVKPIIRILL